MIVKEEGVSVLFRLFIYVVFGGGVQRVLAGDMEETNGCLSESDLRGNCKAPVAGR